MADQASKLRAFESALEAADPQDSAAFQALISEGIDLLSLELKALAEPFGVSPASISRWRHGKNAPHPAMRPMVYTWLRRRAADRRRLLERRRHVPKSDAVVKDDGVHRSERWSGKRVRRAS